MFYYTNLEPSELTAFAGRETVGNDQTYSNFKMLFPIQLEYISFHPDNADEYFNMASIAPDRTYYASISRDEIGGRLKGIHLHRHSFYELLFVIEGSVYQVIENKRHLYTPGSCCLLNKNVLHTEEHETDFEVAFLQISDEVLADVYKDLTEGFFRIEKERPKKEIDIFLKESLFTDNPYDKKYIDFIPHESSSGLAGEAGHVFKEIAGELLEPGIGSTHRIKSMLAKLVFLLSNPEIYETKPIQIGTDAENLLYDQIDKIMHATYGRATRSFLESELHYSGDYLNKITKKYTGLSIHDFGMSICMSRAADDLLKTNKTISDIALDLGFSNRTYFYKQFEKIYHQSPAEFRKGFTK